MYEKIKNEFLKLIRINSVSKNEAAVSEYIKKVIKSSGYSFNEDFAWKKINGDTGNIIVKIKGKNKKHPALLFLAHIDTILPTDKLKIVETKNMIKSDGSTILGADDRSAVAVLLEVIRNVKSFNSNHADIYFIFTVAEEIGLLGSKNMNLKPYKGSWGFILDSSSPVGTVINRAPFKNDFRIILHGKAAHAGIEPEKGINSINIASKGINEVKTGRIDNETTLNFGIINGGKANNIVADRVEISGEMRSHSLKKINDMVKNIKNVFGNIAKKNKAKAEFFIERDFDGFVVEEDNNIIKFAKDVINELNLPYNSKRGGGGSDANVLNKNSIKSVVLGCGYENAHSVNECINTAELYNLYRLVMKVIEKTSI